MRGKFHFLIHKNSLVVVPNTLRILKSSESRSFVNFEVLYERVPTDYIHDLILRYY